MDPKFNTPTTRTETPSTLVNVKRLATRTALILAMGTGGVIAYSQSSNLASKPPEATQIANAEIQNKEAIDEAYNRAKRLSDVIGVPIQIVVTNEKTYFGIRDRYTQPSNTTDQVFSCTGTMNQVALTEYKQENIGLTMHGFLGGKCVLQLPIEFFEQGGNPVENFKSQYPKMYEQITTNITQYEFTNEQYVMLAEKLVDIIDNKGDGKNIKNVIIYVSPLMAYQVNSELNKVLQALNVPGLKRQNITFSSELTHKTLLKMKNDKVGVKLKGRDGTILINLPKMMETMSK